ncbi:hypothetical protein G7Y89_g14281 [Cudoniella acicularis]|uniref:polynucleotide adenylyltransferase n=1 Tax=Cudoniella acicularis TaxID=354080 RepID=A0A8H4R3F3_9HELO|nr:hypothetical protein G7Y89_g14281 [Cudoniella acicularis]
MDEASFAREHFIKSLRSSDSPGPDWPFDQRQKNSQTIFPSWFNLETFTTLSITTISLSSPTTQKTVFPLSTMFPSSEKLTGGGNLESRLRDLILNNANAKLALVPADIPEPQVQPQLPPHMLSASLPEQQEYLANLTRPRPRPQPAENTSVLPNQLARKRPNQAQRRQMNSQLSIPIDPRPSQAGRGPGSGGYSKTKGIRRTDLIPHGFHSPGLQPLHSPHAFYSQRSPQSPMHQYQSGPTGQAPRPSPNQNQFNSGPFSPRPSPQGRQLYHPGPYQGQGRGVPYGNNPEETAIQSAHLEALHQQVIPNVGIDPEEEAEKEAFRTLVEQACRDSIAEYERTELGNSKFDSISVELQCFGSMMSGFATKASDMDLALLSPKSQPAPDSTDSPIPRLLEKKLLDMGFGARLLTRTRVPIIKLCEKPTEKLKADLLLERQKWESGFDEDCEERDDINNPESSPRIVADSTTVATETEANVVPDPGPQETVAETYEDKLASLQQKERQSLGDYHNNAKRLLRKLGGRDVSASAPNLNDEECKILNDVCKAFISGLLSKALIAHLQNYQSIAPLFDPTLPPVNRTLHGVFLQMEGERLAMTWESRPLTENTTKREDECLTIVEAWRGLQDWQIPITESLKYNKELYMASEKLKRISSLQLVFLEQIQHEEPVYYYGRAQRLLDDLKGRGTEASSDTVDPIVIAHYISGIGHTQIRESLQESVHKDVTLLRVGLRHRALQLAIDYEHALKIGKYDDDNRPYVEQCIALLRDLDLDHERPKTGEEISLLAKMRSLPDPTSSSPNKPRDRYKDHLEFPKSNIGVQCDINFSAHLALHNTLLLRCYSHCDPRVKQMILFVKNWAKLRGINTPYRGTLSSYGYVLMVLHYLVNIAQPFVCPNLQSINKDPPHYLPPAEIEARTTCNGCDVRFWRNEAEIKNLADRKMLNHNHDSIGLLLRGFFEYFAQNGPMTTVQHRSFDWGREVLSLRSQGGLLTKQEKGWTGAKTVVETSTIAPPPTPSTTKAPDSTAPNSADSTQPTKVLSPGEEPPTAELKTPKLPPKVIEETKEIRHRYLFAIEDPFELEHNVARTVTHNGIVNIRDEFRRAWRIIRNVGKPEQRDGGLLDPVETVGGTAANSGWLELLHLLQGPPAKGENARK